jgi:hypothetical protein
MAGVRFCTGLLFSAEIETEILSAFLTGFKKVLIQNRAADLTIMELHLHQSHRDRGCQDPWVRVFNTFNTYAKIFEISPLIPSPSDGGGRGWGWTELRPFGPLPSIPSHRGEGRFLGNFQKVRDKASDFNV